MKKISKAWPRLTMFLLVATLLSCASIAGFDQYSYIQSTSLKVDVLSTMDLGLESYAIHEKEVKELELKLRKAYEYERFRPMNTVTAEMYRLLLDPKGDLIGGYYLLWKSKGKLGSFYIDQKKEQVSAAFDEIAILESKKIKKR